MRKIVVIVSGKKEVDSPIVREIALLVVQDRGNYMFSVLSQDTPAEAKILELIGEMGDFDPRRGYPLVVLMTENYDRVLLALACPLLQEIPQLFTVP